MRLGSQRRELSSDDAAPNSSRPSRSRRSEKLPQHKQDLCSMKARGFRPKSSNTTPLRSSIKSAGMSTHGVPCPIPISTPETARILQHWRHHQFSSVRPFFCEVEAVETAIWLTEGAPQSKNGKRLLEH